MPLTRNQKEELLDQYSSGLAAAPHAFLLAFEGLTVPQATDLRDRVREQGGSYTVVKNRLALRAIGGTPMEVLGQHFQGATAVAFSNDDPVALAKALTDFAKDVPRLEFKAGLVDGQEVAGDDIKAIASLPSRDELIAKLVFLLQSPITRFVRSLGAIPQQFVSVLEQVRQKKEQEGEA